MIFLEPYRRYADFSGRSNRKEYWSFTIFGAMIAFSVSILNLLTGSGDGISFFSILYALFVIGSLIPNLAVTVRRLHDSNKSGWWFLVALIPLLGAIALLVLTLLPGTDGENQYGEQPE
ncbi:MAG: DUF805 domain-containing protein [Cyanobacteria bacterium P01_H01_bin.74]